MTESFLQKLKELKKYGIKNNVPNISETLGRFLNILIKNKGIKNILEIGTANGYSTLWMADAIKKTNGKIITFEVSMPSYKEANENFKNFKLNKYINSKFANFLEPRDKSQEPEFFDLIFIDGQKNKTLDFFNKSVKFLDFNGLIIIDDVIKFKSKMSDFYDYIEGQKKYEYVILPIDIDDGIMIITKK